MFCFIALLVFSILGIFSATHRKFAKEAFDCVFRRVTFRPCNTGFREKVRGIILVALMRRSSFFAKIFNKYFELIAWIFFILMIASTAYVARGGYNFYLYGNCNGINEDGFCLFDPTGENNKVSPVESICSPEELGVDDLTLDFIDLNKLLFIDNNSENTVVFIGCYTCEYTRKVYPDIMKLLKKEKPNFYFGHLPVNHESNYISKYDYCAQVDKSRNYWDFMNLMFDSKIEDVNNPEYLLMSLEKSGYNIEEINKCINSPETTTAIDNNIYNVGTTNIYGTPLVFINGEPLVGPKPYRVYKSLLK
ncbi:MAG: thioredoxin domain-containing protein [Patescibacteria group bacterium]|jgi:hypothetical protein|nr:thioredoxin domain-containing protein [Patescibacteria group bacterium]